MEYPNGIPNFLYIKQIEQAFLRGFYRNSRYLAFE